jgi:GNAT superfamily N-acetyltransferase
MTRPLKDTDYAITKQLFQSVFDPSEDPYFIDLWKFRNQEASLGIWNTGCLVAAAIVNDGKLEYIFVDPTQQAQGLGSKLLNAILVVCPNLHLNPVDDPVVCGWYEKKGFQLKSELDTPWGTRRCYVRHTHDLR